MPVIINGTTGVAGVDGSASTPAVQGTDTNTGMFFPAADTIAFAEGGTEVMRIDSSGNLRVGSSSTALNSINSTNTFGFKNRIINGAMMISQRNGTSSITATDGSFGVDRFKTAIVGTGVFTMQQSTTVPTGFSFSQLLTVTTADSSIAATDEYSYRHFVEGFNFADMMWGTANAQTVTLSFWVRSSVTGTYAVGLRNDAANRTYPATYTISAANTWEQKTITIAGDTTGTWVGATNGIGVGVIFSLGAGSNYQGTANSWNNGNLWSTSSATQWISNSGATFFITGVQLEKGSTATSFDYRPYGTELALCQRYCFKMSTTSNYGPYGMGHGTGGTTNFRTIIKTAQTMRAQPSLSFSAANTFQWSFGNVLTAISAAEYGTDAFSVGCDTTGVSSNGAYMLTSANNTTSYILATAEL